MVLDFRRWLAFSVSFQRKLAKETAHVAVNLQFLSIVNRLWSEFSSIEWLCCSTFAQITSRRIVDAHPQSIIGLEDLTHIRERSKRKRGKKASKKQRRANGHVSRWAFAELHDYLAYKATLAGTMAVKVDTHYTSKACPMCGYTCDANRPSHGLLFVCQI